MDTCLEVYPGYQQHRTAMHTVAHFLGIEIWRVAETLSCRIKNHGRPRMYLVKLADYPDKKLLNISVRNAKNKQPAVARPVQTMCAIEMKTFASAARSDALLFGSDRSGSEHNT